MKKHLAMAMILCFMIAMTFGCAPATVSQDATAVNNYVAANEIDFQLGISAAVDLLIKDHPADGPKIVAIVQRIQAGITAGTLVSAASIAAYLQTQLVTLGLSPEDANLMTILSQNIQKAALNFFNKYGLTPAQQLTEIGKILTWASAEAALAK
jgi:hypothetical protein